MAGTTGREGKAHWGSSRLHGFVPFSLGGWLLSPEACLGERRALIIIIIIPDGELFLSTETMRKSSLRAT